jgi:predicted ATPase
MKLARFRIRMYKSVLDSGDVDVAALTVLVGKNEAGKTTLLRALQKFNPFTPDPYSIKNEWPRARRDERSESQVVCEATFALEDEERSTLTDITGTAVDISSLVITKDYAGNFEVLFPDDVVPDRLHPNDIDDACKKLPILSEPAGGDFKAQADALKMEVRRLAGEGRFTEMMDTLPQNLQRLREIRTPGGQQPQHQHEESFLNEMADAINPLVEKLKKTPSMQRKAHEYVISRLPTFVYMDEYRSFDGSALLDQVKQRRDSKKPTDADKTFLTILSLAALNLDQLVAQGNQPDRMERQLDLADGAATLTDKIAKHWKTLRYQVQFIADAQEFMTMVRDPKDKALIKLEERSRGFQWFFSFDLMLMHETRGTLKNCVILLDEPGLHLHPSAQRDLLARLEEYAKGNTLIYTTHLPFMIDLEHPDRIRVITETENGAAVTDDLTLTQPEAKLTLQAALGMSSRSSYLVAPQTLVVEGVDDHWIISELSNLLVRSGKEGLPDGVLVTPAGGASEATYLATFMIGQELDVVALYDTDGAGNTAKDKLVKNWLTRYKDRHATALSLGPAVGMTTEDFAVEDLFPEALYLEHVQEVYKKQLSLAGVTELALPPRGMLSKRVETALAAHGIALNKGSVAKRLCAAIRHMKTANELPKETLKKATALFTAIAAAFVHKD